MAQLWSTIVLDSSMPRSSCCYGQVDGKIGPNRATTEIAAITMEWRYGGMSVRIFAIEPTGAKASIGSVVLVQLFS